MGQARFNSRVMVLKINSTPTLFTNITTPPNINPPNNAATAAAPGGSSRRPALVAVDRVAVGPVHAVAAAMAAAGRKVTSGCQVCDLALKRACGA